MTGKILVLSNSTPGLIHFRAELLQTLCKTHEVTVCSADAGHFEELESIGCKYITLEFDRRGMNPLSDFKLMLSFRKIIKKEKPDVVLTYTIKPNV